MKIGVENDRDSKTCVREREKFEIFSSNFLSPPFLYVMYGSMREGNMQRTFSQL